MEKNIGKYQKEVEDQLQRIKKIEKIIEDYFPKNIVIKFKGKVKKWGTSAHIPISKKYEDYEYLVLIKKKEEEAGKK